jgi:serine/threonine-protein kinase
MIQAVIGNKYRVLRELGRGGMGAVYEAAHVQTGRRVALKLMRVNDRSDEAATSALARFQREALAAGRLETRHVVQVFDAGTDETTGEHFIAMELLEGEDIGHLNKRLGPLPPRLAAAITAQACAGLEKAHAAGVIHRDIKPSNLFLCRNEDGTHTVKVVDFGIAKMTLTDDDRLSAESGTLTETGTLIGSPHYMSPEQVKSSKTIDHRADLWSLGIVLYKCLSGRTPFDSSGSLGEVIVAVCSEDAASVQDHAPWVAKELAGVIRQALARDVRQRLPSARAFIDQLAPFAPEHARITTDMLVPLAASERGAVAPRRTNPPARPPQDAPTTGSSPHILGPQSHGPQSHGTQTDVNPATIQVDLSAMNASLVSTTSSVTEAPAGRRWVLPVAAGALLLLLGGVGAAYANRHFAKQIAPHVSATASPEPAPAASTATPSRAEKIAVGPAGVSVMLDGHAAPVAAGAIAIAGAAGCVHKVTVRLGSRETTADVILTDKGPIPATVALPAQGAPPAAPTRAAPVAAAAPSTTARPTKPTSTAPPKPSAAARAGSFDSRFE